MIVVIMHIFISFMSVKLTYILHILNYFFPIVFSKKKES